MAAAVRCGSAGSWAQLKDTNSRKNVRNKYNNKKKGFRVSCGISSSAAVSDPYKTLRINPDASESEIKKAFRQLALQMVMSNLRGETSTLQTETSDYYDEDEPLRGMNDQDWDMWEEWMGWEGAGIRDYSSHINPYI